MKSEFSKSPLLAFVVSTLVCGTIVGAVIFAGSQWPPCAKAGHVVSGGLTLIWVWTMISIGVQVTKQRRIQKK